MKTEVLKLSTPMDLCETALWAAREKIEESRREAKPHLVHSHWILRIPSQEMGAAFFLARGIGASVELSPTYAPDEWSLELHYLDAKRDNGVFIVHSEGA